MASSFVRHMIKKKTYSFNFSQKAKKAFNFNVALDSLTFFSKRIFKKKTNFRIFFSSMAPALLRKKSTAKM